MRNDGTRTSPSTTLRYYRSTDATITTSDASLGTDAVGPLAASEISLESITRTAGVPRTYYFGACVDAVAGESDTDNNCSAAVRVVVRHDDNPPPDLEVATPAVSDPNPAPAAALTLSATVRNTGDGDAAATTLRYYRSSDGTISISDMPVGTDPIVALPYGGTISKSIPLTAPSTAGTYCYGACVDAVAGESDTANNCSVAVRLVVGDGDADGDCNGNGDGNGDGDGNGNGDGNGDGEGDDDGDGDDDGGGDAEGGDGGSGDDDSGSGDDDGDGQDGGDEGGGGEEDDCDNTPPRAQCPRPQESAASASISNRCDDFDEGYCHRRQLGEVFLRRNASSTVVLLESESDFDLCIYDRDRADEWPKPIYVARKEDCVNYSLDSHGLQAQLSGKPEDHGVEIAELPDIARMDYCVVPFGDAVGRWDVRFHQPATLYGTVAPGSRRCPRWYGDNGETCASSGGSNYANLTVTLENCRGAWIDKGGSCDEPFVVSPEERVDVADDGQEKCVVVNEDRTLRDVDRVNRPTLELAYCFFGDGTRRLGTPPD